MTSNLTAGKIKMAHEEADESINLLLLPNVPLLNILSYLDYEDLISCCKTCQKLRTFAQNDTFWKNQCYFLWKCTSRPNGIESWKEFFICWYRDFGRYVHIYKAIRKAWDQIEAYTEKFLPWTYSSLQNGATETELDTVEAKMSLTLPDSLRCAYRMHNGQKFGPGAGVMGSITVSGHFRTEYLLSLQTASDNVQKEGEVQDCIPLTFCYRSHVSQLLALSDKGGYIKEQITYLCPDNTSMDTIIMDNFISANGFLQWFTRYAQQLEDDTYPRIQDQLCLFYQEPSCLAVSHSIEVKVATCFVPELSTVNPPHFFHTYYITMSMDPEASSLDSCRLETRHWTITDMDGKEDLVEGPGVVGQNPTMKPGSTFSWASSTTFTTTHGSMRGYFTMKTLSSGKPLLVECPTFHMKCLPYQTSAERRERIQLLKKNQ